MKYSAVLYNRWFGCPCEDHTERLPAVTIDELTTEAARAAAAAMGYQPTTSSEDDVQPSILTAEIHVKPTRPGAESAWIFFYSL